MAKDFYPIGTVITPISDGYTPGVYVVIHHSESGIHWSGKAGAIWIKRLSDGRTLRTPAVKAAYIEISHPLELIIYGV